MLFTEIAVFSLHKKLSFEVYSGHVHHEITQIQVNIPNPFVLLEELGKAPNIVQTYTEYNGFSLNMLYRAALLRTLGELTLQDPIIW